MMSQDEDHLRLLSIFHYIMGGLTALGSLVPVIHLAIGVFFILAPGKLGGDAPPVFVGWILIFMAIALMIAGMALAACTIAAGRFLARRTHYTFCLVLAAIQCIFFPFGTVLGVFTIMVLARESVKSLFPSKAATPRM